MPGSYYYSGPIPIEFLLKALSELAPEMNTNEKGEPIYSSDFNLPKILLELNLPEKDELIFLDMAVMYAVQQGKVELLRYLLNYKIKQIPFHSMMTPDGILWKNASFEVVDCGMKTLLGAAAYRGQIEIIKCLVHEYGVDINAYSFHGYKALHEAVMGDSDYLHSQPKENKQAQIVDFLIQSGADLSLKTRDNYPLTLTPYEMAQRCKNRDDCAYQADNVRPILTWYHQKNIQKIPITFQEKVDSNLQECLSSIGETRQVFPDAIAKIVHQYLSYDIAYTPSSIEPNREKNSLKPTRFCIIS